MADIIAIVEGYTEEKFITEVLYNHLWPLNIFIIPVKVSTKLKKGDTLARGGHARYHIAKKDILRSLNRQDLPYVTTMLDYYKLPNDYPGKSSMPDGDCYAKVNYLEQEFESDVNHTKFIPYFQLHEFEAILFTSPQEICNTMVNNHPLRQLERIKSSFGNPEKINDNPSTCPSRRISDLFTEYEKDVHGSLISRKIGLSTIRQSCPHFNQWLAKLESIQ